jgi:hypothetical protein
MLLAMRLSVIVVHWARPELLRRCLASLATQTDREFESIVVDNGSLGDDLQAVLADAAVTGLVPRVVRLTDNLGFAGGANAGLRAASGELLALLNDDAEADPDWIRALRDAAEGHPWASSFACRILAAPGGKLLDSAGDLFTRCGEGAGRGHGQPDGPAYDRDCEVFGACAGAAMYRRDLFARIGLFDEGYFHTSEDVDLALRARLAGERCVYVAAAKVLHLGAASREQMPERSAFLQSRNAELALFSNLPASVLLRILPWRLARLAWGLAVRLRLGGLRPYLSGKLAALADWRRVGALRRQRLGSASATAAELWALLDPHWHLERLGTAVRRLPALCRRSEKSRSDQAVDIRPGAR